MPTVLEKGCDAAPERERPALPDTAPVTALFAFSTRLDRDTMRLFSQTHQGSVHTAAVAATGEELLEQLRSGVRPQVIVLDALLTKPSAAEVLQQIDTMQLKPQPAILVLVPIPEETAARRALSAFSKYEIMLRPYRLRSLFDEVYRMGSNEQAGHLYHLRRCCSDLLDELGARATMHGYHYVERMVLYAIYAAQPQPIGALQQYVASEENVEVGTVISAVNRLTAGMAKRGTELYRSLCRRCGRPETAALSNGQLLEGMLWLLRDQREPYLL